MPSFQDDFFVNNLLSDSQADSIELLNGNMRYYPHFLSEADAHSLMDQLMSEIAWQSGEVTLYGKSHYIPRLQAWLGESAYAYRYSGHTLVSETWPNSLSSLAQQISILSQCDFNTVLGNLYRNGQDSMGWHADDEPELGHFPVIASLSLGAERDFVLRPIGETRQSAKISLAHGSLLIMNAGMQSRWQHALPKRARCNAPRMNLTFRKIVDNIND
ncbi:MAG: alpha-ketoglutarate-dependent dioxygenase AlkB [Oleibacter sp.]|nr:alpha-ketoglutarate-dependent dioxygenase AlkB [Thalassolituus sp.]